MQATGSQYHERKLLPEDDEMTKKARPKSDGTTWSQPFDVVLRCARSHVSFALPSAPFSGGSTQRRASDSTAFVSLTTRPDRNARPTAPVSKRRIAC